VRLRDAIGSQECPFALRKESADGAREGYHPVECRRRYSDEERAAVLAQRDEPGATVVGVSRRLWEKHDKRRTGLEVYYTGRQALEENPCRSHGRLYFEVGMLGEIALDKVWLLLNAENIFGARQAKHNRLLRPSRSPDGRWTVDAWAPLEGFTLNGGVRLRFGGDER